MKKNTNKYADLMLDRISQCIEEETKNLPAVSGAVVSSVNTDGTINVCFPPDYDKIFTNLSNQTPFLLEPGDSVELLLKDGSYNNCWIIAKHQTTFDGSIIAKNLNNNYATMDDLKKVQASLLTEIDPVFINSAAYGISPQDIANWNNASVVQPATTNPVMDGVVSVGSKSTYARADHVHPTDTSRAAVASPIFSGVPEAPTAADGTNTDQIATTAFVKNAVDAIPYPVTSVNNKTGEVALNAGDVGAVPTSRTINGIPLSSNITLSASDVEALPATTIVPTRTSQLTNDSGYITSSALPEEVFIVNYNGTTADKTFAEIRQAWTDKKDCIAFYENSIYFLEYSHANYVVFSKAGTSGSGNNEQGFVSYLTCTSSDVWSASSLTLSSKAYVDNLVNSLGTVLNFKGTCTTISDLPVSGNTGDVWIVTEDNSEYVWDGTNWEEFGPTVDLSGYLQITNLANSTGNSTTTAMTQNATTQELNTKANIASTVSNIVYDTTNKKITKTINGTTSDVVTIGTLKTDLNITAADVGALPDDTDLTIYMQKDVDYVTAGKKANTTLGSNATAEGYNVTASGSYSHSEGNSTTASKNSAHAEGYYTTASGNYSHAEGYSTTASGNYSHAEGRDTEASGANSHAEGDASFATGAYSHAEGQLTSASGTFSHAEGNETTANHRAQHVFGEHNVIDNSANAATARGNYVEIVGNGTSASARSNARTLDWNGNETLAGKLTVGSAPTNTMDVTTKQYVDNITPVATTTTPAMDGVASVGSETTWAKGDHVHPSDTTKAPIASPAFTGIPTAPTAATGTNTTQIATTEFVNNTVQEAGSTVPGTALPLMDGTASAGTAAPYSREDHVHPSDTTRAPLVSPAFTGTPTAPTATLGTNTTQLATTEFVNNSIAVIDVLPSQGGNAGKFLTTDGSIAGWEEVVIPEETFVISVTSTTVGGSTVLTADKTYTEILAAFGAKKEIVAILDNESVFYLQFFATNAASFMSPSYNTSGNPRTYTLEVDYNDTWTFNYVEATPANIGAQPSITTSGILKGNGSGGISAAVSGTDYQAAITASGLLKGNGAGGVSAAVAGTDYQAPISNNVTGSGTNGYLTKFNGANTVTNGPALGSSTTTYLRNDGNWATPTNTTTGTTYAAASVPNNTTFGTNGSIYNVYNATKHGNITVTLNVANWNTTSKTISVTASGVTASNTVMVSPAPASTSVYSAAGVYCSAQGSNSLTFTCSSIPTAALTVNVVYFS